MKKLPRILTIIVIIIGVIFKVSLFRESGKDFGVYVDALTDVTMRINPYQKTVESYNNSVDISQHKFSYLPGFLFLYLPFFLLVNTPDKLPIFPVLAKIPVLLADIGICVLLYKELKDKNKWAAFFAALVWQFNPYFALKQNYIYMDNIPIFFMLLGLYYLEKNDKNSAIFYALSCIFKTFPIILLPIFFFRAKDKIKFLTWFIIPFIVVSIPFLYDPVMYIKGALLVHSNRSIQGKPFLHTISFKTNLEFIRVVPLTVYTSLSVFGGWVLVTINELVKKKHIFVSKYKYSLVPFLIFYMFTPVFNKTYLLWALPIVILGSYALVNEMKKPMWLFYILVGIFYLFYLYYLSIWGYGLHVDYKYY